MQILDVRKIWEDGYHNAFTDICRWSGRYWLCFRHANNHSCSPSHIYILSSQVGRQWEKTAEVSEGQIDLRDPKFIVSEDRPTQQRYIPRLCVKS